MQKRIQSVTSISFASDRELQRRYERRSISASYGRGAVEESKEPGGELLSLCQEVAGAILARRASRECEMETRSTIRDGLVDTVGCAMEQADRIFDLALEVIHVHAYGRYRRNPLELAVLIEQALGKSTDPANN